MRQRMVSTFQSKLIEKKEIAPHIYLLRCSFPENKEWTFTAGQYMIFHIPQTDGHPVRRLYSIASAPSQRESIDFIIEIIPNGIGGNYVLGLTTGNNITLQGPAGIFTHKESPRSPVYLATGTGIAPMHSMIGEMCNTKTLPTGTTLLWGLKNHTDAYMMEEWAFRCKENNMLNTFICFSREENLDGIHEDCKSISMCGRVTVILDTWKSQNTLADHDYYLCGSKHVVESLREYLAQNGVPKEQVYFEKFT